MLSWWTSPLPPESSAGGDLVLFDAPKWWEWVGL